MGTVLGEEDKYTGHKKRNRSAADRLRIVTQKNIHKMSIQLNIEGWCHHMRN